jgi:hypothetical protein
MRKCQWKTRVLVSFAILSITSFAVGGETPKSSWRDTDDHKGIQYRYSVVNGDFCSVDFRDLNPTPKTALPNETGDTDIAFTFNVADKNGRDYSNSGNARIWNLLGRYGTANIENGCSTVTSIVVTKLERGK